MIRNLDRIPVYIKQYERIPLMLRDSYDSFAGEEVLNHLLDRDALEDHAKEYPELIAADQALSSALSTAEQLWWDRLRVWAAQCEFAKSLWWISVQYNARRGSATPLSLESVLGGSADAWIKALGSRVAASDDPVRVGTITGSFHTAMLVGVAQRAGVIRDRIKRGPKLQEGLSRFAQVIPTLVLPGSIVIGFQLPRERPGEPASGPASESLAALDVVMQAGERYTPEGDSVAIADLIDDDFNRDQLWGSLKSIYNAVGSDTERVEIVAASPGNERTVSWPVHGKSKRRPRAAQDVRLTGNVRAIDLDRHSLRIQVDGAQWCTAVKTEPSLFMKIDQLAKLVIGQNVVVSGNTTDDKSPARAVTATEIELA